MKKGILYSLAGIGVGLASFTGCADSWVDNYRVDSNFVRMKPDVVYKMNAGKNVTREEVVDSYRRFYRNLDVRVISPDEKKFLDRFEKATTEEKESLLKMPQQKAICVVNPNHPSTKDLVFSRYLMDLLSQ